MSVVTILLLADIHSNVVALNAVLQTVYQKYGEPDYVITLGDYVGYNCYHLYCNVCSWMYFVCT